MLIHQGWFTALYSQHLLASQSFEFLICILQALNMPLILCTNVFYQERLSRHICESGTNKNKFISGLKFSSININSIRGKKNLSCWPSLISINPRLLPFKKLKLTALCQPQNCSQKLVLTMCIEKIELLMAVA